MTHHVTPKSITMTRMECFLYKHTTSPYMEVFTTIYPNIDFERHYRTLTSVRKEKVKENSKQWQDSNLEAVIMSLRLTVSAFLLYYIL